MSFNNRSSRDNRFLFSGKDGVILDGSGNLLSTVDSFQARVSFANSQFQPLGTALVGEFMVSYSVTLTIVQCVVESDKFIRDVFDFFKSSRHSPNWTFVSTLKGYDGSEERIVYYDCVPSGDLDLHNIAPGDIVKRSWTMHVNSPPELQKLLSMPSD